MKAFFLGLIISATCAHAAAACDIAVRAKSYEKYVAGTYYDILSLPKSYLADLGSSKSYNYLAHFQNVVKAKTKVDHVSLLERQKPFYKNMPEETQRFEKVLAKKMGRVRVPSCLENFLTDNHLRTFSSETEYSAYVMTKPESDLALIIVYTQVLNGTNSPTAINHLVEGYRKQGWNLESHIHNHPFFFKNPYGDIAGTLLPSAADVTSYQRMTEDSKLRSAIITNGFESFIMYKNEFNKF